MKILITGDLHIGRRSTSVADTGVVDMNILSTKNTWLRIVDYAISREIDVVILTGDIIDENNKYFEAINPLQNGLERLNSSGIEVFMVAGNHDFDVLQKVINYQSLSGTHLLGSDGKWESYIYEKGAKKVQFLGWSFTSKYYSKDPTRLLDINMAREDIFTIAIVHGDARGSAERRYAPIDERGVIRFNNIDFWAAGHIHLPDNHKGGRSKLFYPGSPHALSPKERGKHGITILTLEEGRDFKIEQLPFSPVRYECLSIDLSEAEDIETVGHMVTKRINTHIDSLIDDDTQLRYLVYDLTLTGSFRDIKAVRELRENLLNFSSEIFNVNIRNVELDLTPYINMEELANDSSYIGVLAKTIVLLQRGESNLFIDRVITKWIDRYRKLSINPVYEGLQMIDHDDETIRELARKAIEDESKRLIIQLLETKGYDN